VATFLDFRTFVLWINSCFADDLENRYHGGVFAMIESDSERVKEGVGGGGWDVVFVTVRCHFTEFTEEFNTCGGPGVVAWWPRGWRLSGPTR